MKNTLLIRRYSKAFLEFAIQHNMEDEGLVDLELVSKTIIENRELRSILSQPFVLKSKKKTIIRKVFEGKISNVTLRFVHLMIENNHPEIIHDIIDTYQKLYNDYKNISEVTITTAVAIDEEKQNRIVGFIKKKTKGDIKIINKIDKNIIGGFIINYLDYQYDESIKTKLKNLEALFTNNLYIKGY